MKQQLISSWQQRLQEKIIQFLPKVEVEPKQLHKALHYSVLNGGKRVRPMLVYATGQSFNCSLDLLDAAACASELMHAYSLIHDDLPAMDNDDLRRGKASCHIAFDEATAILAGDALQTLAFEIIAVTDNGLESDKKLQMIQVLANASGSLGMAGGQSLDLLGEKNQKLNEKDISFMYSLKTGALIQASVSLAAIAADLDTSTQQRLYDFSKKLGLAFQIQDDILDIETCTENLGKQQGSDLAKDKSTYPKIVGIDAAKNKVKTLIDDAYADLDKMGKSTSPLASLTDYLLYRKN